jgi:hypothetical protein
MATTYGSLTETIYRQLSDPDQENPSFSEETVLDAVNAAHDAVLPWVPNYDEIELVATSGSGLNDLELPDDVYDIQAVQLVDDSGKFISRATLAAGTARGNTSAENDWTESPKGYLSFAYDLSDGDTVKVYYLAHWPKPATITDTDFVIQVPSHAHMGMIFYALSVILNPTVMDTATLGTFKSKVDSGTPVHNPAKDNANWFRSQFLQEMKMMPPYQKARS